jgi:ADP-ribose pyrophosphatase
MGKKETNSKTWEVLDSKDIFIIENRITVSVQCIKLPDGKIIDDYYQIKLPEAVIIVASTDEKEIVMSRQYLHGFGRVSVVMPAGTIEKGETALKAARRELLEETGYSSREWKALASFAPHTNYGCGRIHFFFAGNAKKTAEPMSGDFEEMEIILMTENDIINAIRNEDIISVGTITAWTLANTFLINNYE